MLEVAPWVASAVAAAVETRLVLASAVAAAWAAVAAYQAVVAWDVVDLVQAYQASLVVQAVQAWVGVPSWAVEIADFDAAAAEADSFREEKKCHDKMSWHYYSNKFKHDIKMSLNSVKTETLSLLLPVSTSPPPSVKHQCTV